MRRRLFLRAAVAAWLVLVPFVNGARAEDIDAAKAAKLKSAYLLNFVKYAQWPEDSFPAPDSPIVITLVGECDVTDLLGDVVSGSEPVGGRRIKLHGAALPSPGRENDETAWASIYQSLKGAQLLYICGLDPGRVGAILRAVGDDDVLTVSDLPGFAAGGGMLGFVLRGNRILFEANLDTIQKSRVSVSAKVLQLAQIVADSRR